MERQATSLAHLLLTFAKPVTRYGPVLDISYPETVRDHVSEVTQTPSLRSRESKQDLMPQALIVLHPFFLFFPLTQSHILKTTSCDQLGPTRHSATIQLTEGSYGAMVGSSEKLGYDRR